MYSVRRRALGRRIENDAAVVSASSSPYNAFARCVRLKTRLYRFVPAFVKPDDFRVGTALDIKRFLWRAQTPFENNTIAARRRRVGSRSA